jgi:hypothetical protein
MFLDTSVQRGAAMSDKINTLWQRFLATRISATNDEIRQFVWSLKRKDQFPEAPSRTPDEWTRLLAWQKNNQPPLAMSRGQFEDRTLTEFSTERARQILSLARPAIGLWPQEPSASKEPPVSRHGGNVLAPCGWDWPTSNDVPMGFLAQINCGQLTDLPGGELLSPHGVLAFFGDLELISGCFPESDEDPGMVCHWAAEGLVLARSPAQLSDDYLAEYSTAEEITFRPFVDLPDTSSRLFEQLDLNREEAERYYRLRWDLSHHGIPENLTHYCDVTSKLLGWPDLVQQDFDLW